MLSLRFGNDLHVLERLFILDAGASGSKDMKILRNHLQELRSQIISVSQELHDKFGPNFPTLNASYLAV